MRTKLAVGVVVLAVGLVSSPTQAATVSVAIWPRADLNTVGPGVLYTADRGERNALVVTEGRDSSTSILTVTDPAGVRAGRGCVQAPGDLTQATCKTAMRFEFVDVALGDRDDTAAVDGGWHTLVSLAGGSGDDRLRGAILGQYVFAGGSGNDRMSGGYYDDVFDEGTQRNGRDVMFGGQGVDTADYSGRDRAVHASLHHATADGERGERDRIYATETLYGGAAADRLAGSVGRDYLLGGPGADVLSGLGGGDYLAGGWRRWPVSRTAPVRPRRGPHRDRLYGNFGSDTLVAAPAGGLLAGGPAVDLLVGDRGPDVIDAQDRKPDVVRCKEGRDVVVNDRDDVQFGCERHGPRSGAAIPTEIAMSYGGGTPGVRVRVQCSPLDRPLCSGSVSIRWAAETYRAPFTAAPGEAARIRLATSEAVAEAVRQGIDRNLTVSVATDGPPARLATVRLTDLVNPLKAGRVLLLSWNGADDH